MYIKVDKISCRTVQLRWNKRLIALKTQIQTAGKTYWNQQSTLKRKHPISTLDSSNPSLKPTNRSPAKIPDQHNSFQPIKQYIDRIRFILRFLFPTIHRRFNLRSYKTEWLQKNHLFTVVKSLKLQQTCTRFQDCLALMMQLWCISCAWV